MDEILKNANIIHIAPLFNGAKRKFNKEYIKTFAGQEIEIPNLHHIYRIKTGEQTYELFQLIEQLKLQKEVVYAEPNYIQSLTSIVPAGQAMTADEVEAHTLKKMVSIQSKRMLLFQTIHCTVSNGIYLR